MRRQQQSHGMRPYDSAVPTVRLLSERPVHPGSCTLFRGALGDSVCIIGESVRQPKYRYDHRLASGVNMAITGDYYRSEGTRLTRKETDGARRRASRSRTDADAEVYEYSRLDTPRVDSVRRWTTCKNGPARETLPPLTDSFGRPSSPTKASTASHHSLGSTVAAKQRYSLEPTTAAPNNHCNYAKLHRTPSRGY
eukprot:m.19755 g.19755  ORF g.19755 m.19755 type:complete len:195 (+) comp10041_c0_seq1:64-648(+)